MSTLSESIGLSARAIRLDAGRTLEAVAKATKHFGLAWSTGKVSDFESGRIAPSLPTLYAVAAALSQAIGRPVSLAELFAGEGSVDINDRLSVHLSALRAAVSGQPIAPKVVTPAAATITVPPAVLRRYRLPKWARDIDPSLHAQVLADFSESDARMCKNIGVNQDIGAAAMAKLWGRTLSAERDPRAGPEANAQRRGQISRQLKADLQRVINDGNN